YGRGRVAAYSRRCPARGVGQMGARPVRHRISRGGAVAAAQLRSLQPGGTRQFVASDPKPYRRRNNGNGARSGPDACCRGTGDREALVAGGIVTTPGSANSGTDTEHAAQIAESERFRRWRLLVGGSDEDPLGSAEVLSAEDQRIDGALAAVYDSRGPGDNGGQRSAGLGKSAPRVVGRLGDIRTYFPSTVVQVMQRDALERLNLE